MGRFVQAKGVLDLLNAAQCAMALGASPFHLSLVGNEHLSDPEIVVEARRLASEPELAGAVSILGELDDDRLTAQYLASDALVVPSYHEGYCVPVVEAIAAGAHVIATDAGNLPNLVAGIGRTVPAGDVPALAGAISDLVDRIGAARRGHPLTVLTDAGVVDAATWMATTAEFRHRHSTTAFNAGFWSAVSAALTAAGRETPAWISAAAS